MEYVLQETATQSTAATNYDDEFPCLEKKEDQSDNQKISKNTKSTQNEGSKFQLMEKKKNYPGVGAEFMALLVVGASRVMLGQRVYYKMDNGPKSNSNNSMNSWASKAAGTAIGKSFSLKKQVLKGNPPRGQNKEYHRINISLDLNHEARKSDPFQLRHTIQNLVPDKTLVSDIWKVPSGVAILAPTHAKAATLMQYKKDIENRFGNAVAERQEAWTIFVVGPIPKKIRGLEGLLDPMDDKSRGNIALETQEEVESEVMEIIKNIQTALTGACPRSRPRNLGTAWWNEECKRLCQAYHTARRTGPAVCEKREFRSAVCLAKISHWNSVITEAGTIQDMYRLVKWHKSSSNYQSPSFRCEDGEENRTLPNSYRPISLLSSLGKGLECLIARRLSYWALKLKILSYDQCSALRHRSAVDLTTALHCDLRKAWEAKKNAGMITVDVKGTFDSVSCERLLYRLKNQGWPISLIEWVDSFFSNRTARICLDRVITDPLPIMNGLPQGSTVSPILFLLYVEVQLDRTIAWGVENGIKFDNKKTDLQFFHRKRQYFALNHICRAILPVYKTTPVPIILRESGWGPVIAILKRIHDRLVIRTAAADPRHPLRQRWNSDLFSWIRRGRKVEFSLDVSEPPWSVMDQDKKLREIVTLGRKEGFKSVEKWMQSRTPLDLTVYSDGSSDKVGKAGAGYCIYRGTQEIVHNWIPLGNTVEVYDAEIIGAVEGLRAACSHIMARFATNVAVCLDNEEAVLRLHTGSLTPSSSREIAEFQELCETCCRRNRATVAQEGSVQVGWVPGYQVIKGN
ncbi:hypothetical protein EV44_g3821 [Erysiphe necator]|uniref:Reverse transcriptase domain-containing protein n=1 Tax=Uncinula necator TaxID=52586 RepID=A0A0B1P7A6_UNCNE|nr:hypothetical protein EV44_g3821 [Erysiphe necator]